MPPESNGDTRELQRISQELGEAKAKLAEERNKREHDLNRRLDRLDNGQAELLKEFQEVKEKKVSVERFDELEDRVDSNARLIYIGLGIAVALQVAIPFVWRAFS